MGYLDFPKKSVAPGILQINVILKYLPEGVKGFCNAKSLRDFIILAWGVEGW